jgi:hypothetical protein
MPGAAEAFRLVAAIVQAAQTARRNRRLCRRLAERAEMVGELLRQLQGSAVMQHLETRRPLVALEKTLRQAQRVVVACQGSAAACRFLMGGRHAGQLRDVADDIDSYLLLIPLVSHVHGARPAKPTFPDGGAFTPSKVQAACLPYEKACDFSLARSHTIYMWDICRAKLIKLRYRHENTYRVFLSNMQLVFTTQTNNLCLAPLHILSSHIPV